MGRHFFAFWERKTSSLKPPLKKIVPQFSVSKTLPFHVMKPQNFLLHIFLQNSGSISQFPRKIRATKDWTESGNLFPLEAVPGIYRVLRPSKNNVPSKSNRAAGALFMSNLLITLDKTTLFWPNCKNRGTIKRPPMAQLVASKPHSQNCKTTKWTYVERNLD